MSKIGNTTAVSISKAKLLSSMRLPDSYSVFLEYRDPRISLVILRCPYKANGDVYAVQYATTKVPKVLGKEEFKLILRRVTSSVR